MRLKTKYPVLSTQLRMLLLMLKSNEFKGEIPGVTNLATIAAFTTVENKIPNFNDLVKKAY